MLSLPVIEHAHSDRKAPPRSASGICTGIAGIVAALVAAWALRDWLEPGWLKTLAVLAAAAVAMVAVDVGLYRSHLSPTTGLSQHPLRPLDLRRCARKLVGFWLTIAVIAFGYWLLPEYAQERYQPFLQAARACLPVVALLSPFYVAWVDRRQVDPEDACAQLGALIAGRRPAGWSDLRSHALGWTVKAFFLPLMFGFIAADLGLLWSRPVLPDPLDFGGIFGRLIDLFYLIDVLLAAVAYGLTFRVIDTHLRSVESTLAGWLVCLVCYEPFVKGAGANYLLYDRDNLDWDTVFAPYPWLYGIWGAAILALVFVYVWSTAAFGLRFSNLTNRGIISSGPYRWLKHPAYVAKNLSWWMISVPFISTAGWSGALQSCLLLCGSNLVYVLRARTEERHLARDPAYRAYADFIAEHGLVAVLRRAVRRPHRDSIPAASARAPVA